jgi:NADH-quinone oxidoreductase subunit N
MLACAAIAQIGYLLVGMTVANDAAKSAILFHLGAQALSALGAFGVTALIATRETARDDLADYAGLGRRQPLLAALMSVFVLSLGGLPPTAGFVGRRYLFEAAIEAGDYLLGAMGVLSSIVTAFFCLRLVRRMLIRTENTSEVPAPPWPSTIALVLVTVAVVYAGIMPRRLLDLAAASVATIL